MISPLSGAPDEKLAVSSPKVGIIRTDEKIEALHGGVLPFAAQVILKIDTARAENTLSGRKPVHMTVNYRIVLHGNIIIQDFMIQIRGIETVPGFPFVFR